MLETVTWRWSCFSVGLGGNRYETTEQGSSSGARLDPASRTDTSRSGPPRRRPLRRPNTRLHRRRRRLGLGLGLAGLVWARLRLLRSLQRLWPFLAVGSDRHGHLARRGACLPRWPLHRDRRRFRRLSGLSLFELGPLSHRVPTRRLRDAGQRGELPSRDVRGLQRQAPQDRRSEALRLLRHSEAGRRSETVFRQAPEFRRGDRAVATSGGFRL